MNFIREVVDIVNGNEVTDAKRNVVKLLSEIKRYQYKVKSYIDTNYVDFLSNLSSNELFLDEGGKLIFEVETLLEGIENETKHDLYSAVEDLKQYIDELREVSVGLKVSYKIFRIDELFQSLESAKSNNEYLNVMEIVGNIKTLIDDPSDKVFSKLDCYQNIKIKYHIEAEMLLHNLKQRFEQLVQLTEKPFQNTKSVTVRIATDERQLQETVKALFNAKYNPKKLFTFLLDNLFEPIITKPVSIEFQKTNSDFLQLSLSYSLKELSDNLRPNYKVVFRNIETAFSCLAHMNLAISETMSVFSVFGESVKEKFLNLLIHECLMYSIPDTMDEMHESTIVADILEFNSYLVELRILNEKTDRGLVEYANKIGMLFRNRFCANILDSAIAVMRKDLHDMSLVAENNTASVVSNNPTMFPRCMVSKSTLELINLMEKVMREASTADGEISERLLSTVPLILNRYLTEVPAYHSKLLHNIPQQTALFHNNCMFLAYWTTRNADNGIELFASLVKSLQGLGSEHFLNQIKNQRTQLIDILQGFDLSGGIAELGNGPQKIVRQCLRQLDLLKNVWQTILPDVVYNKTMSNLLNDFCAEIVRRIQAMEDISSTIANELVEICSIIMDRAPTIFQDPVYATINVKTWTKLTQLKMILNASLVEITEQWSEGKGPLTLNYKAEEIKHLIRALFQNTDHRANALATII